MLEKATITFLKQLKKHNERPWFDDHKDQYLAAKSDFEQFIHRLLVKYGKTDPAIGLLSVKDCVFRIYRDVRFSKDKTPYKAHFAAGMNKGGKKVHFPGYYLHIEPGGNSYLGGGIWRPDREALHKVRQEIDYSYDDFLAIIQRPAFKKRFGDLSVADKLVRPPKGYDADNPAIEFLKLRSFIAGCSLEDKILTSETLEKEVIGFFKQIKPFTDFLERALDG